jgi:hypothetical protein
LIAAGVKRVETRSWQTRYRGELAIHASLGKVDRKNPFTRRLLALLPEEKLHQGLVVCRCVLKDCVPMDDAFLRWIDTQPTEKLCGEYAPGRFAWILEQVEPLETPVPAKGHLGLWQWEP